MAKFLLGIVVGVIVAVVGSFIVIFALGRIFANKQPTVSANSVLVLTLEGAIPEAAPVDIPFPLGRSQAVPTVRDLWTSLQAAAKDPKIKAILLQPRSLTAGWAKLQEVRSQIAEFKKSAKPVYAFLQAPGSHEYYLASIADKVYLSPDDNLDVKGFLLEETFYKDTLAKVGVQFEVDHIGKYKDAGDTFTRTNMTPETKEVLNQVLDQIFNDFCATIAEGRHKTADEIKALVDNGPFRGAQAKANGLVDELGYEDQVYGALNQRAGGVPLNKIGIKTYFRVSPGKGDRIALLVGEGDIVRGDPGETFGSAPAAIASGAFAKVVRDVRNDSSIKGVVVRVNSPGGDAVASDEILHELKLLSLAKPTAISMSDYAASGGYFVSMTGDPIVSYPNTLTGSIGVLYVRPNLKGLFDKLGIAEDSISRGRFANLDDVTTPLSEAAHQKLHESIAATYQSFVGKVAVGRKRKFEEIDALAQGRVWMGAQAKQNGLIDELGGLTQAVAIVRRKAGLSQTGDTNLVIYPSRKTLFEMLATATPETLEDAAIERRLRSALPGLPSQALLKGGVLQMLPFRITIY